MNFSDIVYISLLIGSKDEFGTITGQKIAGDRGTTRIRTLAHVFIRVALE